MQVRSKQAVCALLALALALACGKAEEDHRAGAQQAARELEASAMPAEGPQLPPPAARPDEPVAFEDGCLTTECHSGWLGSSNAHAPTATEHCERCHEPDTGEHVYPPKAGLNSVCLECHDVDEAGPIRHGLRTSSSCLGCHDPHGAGGPFLLREESASETCHDCHAPALGVVRHTPYADGLCMTCHEPHESQNPYFLREATDQDHCGTCHSSLVAAARLVRSSHLEIEDGCLACHTAHASDVEGLLNAPVGELCLSCHNDIAQSIEGATVAHEAVLTGDRCLACHDPHASDRPEMLRNDQAELCLGCHGDRVDALDGHTIPDMRAELTDREFAHGPVRSGQCTACHGAHGAARKHLLVANDPLNLEGMFDLKNYSLCFQCHSESLVREAETTTATDFRDGQRNLHTVHITSGLRGRACASCHAVHGSSGPRDIADRVRFEGSSWEMEIGFELTPSGGSCAPGCHAPLPYSRDPESDR
jgi:predicted CXXCH cytochrome family protein